MTFYANAERKGRRDENCPAALVPKENGRGEIGWPYFSMRVAEEQLELQNNRANPV